ncbi:ATP-binding protein [Patescibacteria group bacterium AH-259-L07]|nr:ATP-binding protein [Patescibacteria group bacterium AH-259-L07]
MDQLQINQYIQNQLSRAPYLLRSYTQDDTGNKYLSRNIYIKIKKFINDFSAGQKEIRIIAIPGLRGVGKTTLLAQLFLDLFPQYQKELLYISVDQIVNILRSDLYTVLEEYQKILGVSFEKLDKNIFIFIDEIHFDKNWPSVLKSIYDKSKNIFVVCTGSSALSLQSTADLSRRVIFEKLYPMNFGEYMLLKTKYLSIYDENTSVKFPVKGLKQEIKNALFYSSGPDSCFSNLNDIANKINTYWLDIDRLEIDRYLRFGTMPFALTIRDENKAHTLMNELIDKVIEKDLFELGKFSADTIGKVKNILLMVAASGEVSITSLAKNLTDISQNTLIDVFDSLEKAEMIIRVYPYGSAYKKVRKPSKYYFMSPSLRYTLLSIIEGEIAFEKHKGEYLEDVVSLYLYREFSQRLTSPIYYDSSKGGANFILQIQNKKIAIEIGYGEKGIKQAEYTLGRINGDYGLVVSDTDLSLRGSIVKVPLRYFLLI